MASLNLNVNFLRMTYLNLRTKFSISNSYNSQDHRVHTDTRTTNMAQSTCILLVYTYWYKPRLLLPLTHLCTHLVYPFLITFNAEYIKKELATLFIVLF